MDLVNGSFVYIADYQKAVKAASTDQLRTALCDLQIKQSGIKTRIANIRSEINRRKKENAPAPAGTGNER